MKLYHGSTVQVKNPTLRYGRESTDFGKGFYTTTNFEQAKNWALSKIRTNNQLKAIVSIFEVDNDLINKSQYNTKIFTSPNALTSFLAMIIKQSYNLRKKCFIQTTPEKLLRLFVLL